MLDSNSGRKAVNKRWIKYKLREIDELQTRRDNAKTEREKEFYQVMIDRLIDESEAKYGKQDTQDK